MFQDLSVLDTVNLNFSATGVHIINIALSLIMFGVALEISPSHFRSILKNPKPVWVGLLSQLMVLPALTFVLVLILKPNVSVALGMILVASCPGGNISNFMCSLSKANTALSISLTALSTTFAVVLTPFNFSFWGGIYINLIQQSDGQSLLRPISIDYFQVFQTVFLLLGLPVLLGIIISRRFPTITKKLIKPFKNTSLIFFIVLVVMMLYANLDLFLKHIHLIFIIVLLHNAFALLSGYTVASIFKQPLENKKSITIETGIQNSGLALALMFNPKIFPPDLNFGGMVFIAAWWGIWHIFSGLSLAYFWSKKEIK